MVCNFNLAESVESLKDSRAKILRVIDREDCFDENERKSAIELIQLCGLIMEDINENGEWADMVCELVSGTADGKKWVDDFITDRNNENIRERDNPTPPEEVLTWDTQKEFYDGDNNPAIWTANTSHGEYRIEQWSDGEYYAKVPPLMKEIRFMDLDESMKYCHQMFNGF